MQRHIERMVDCYHCADSLAKIEREIIGKIHAWDSVPKALRAKVRKWIRTRHRANGKVWRAYS